MPNIVEQLDTVRLLPFLDTCCRFADQVCEGRVVNIYFQAVSEVLGREGFEARDAGSPACAEDLEDVDWFFEGGSR